MPAVPTPGEKFNQQYELLEVMGSGGVSTVFKAKQLDGDRLVALKVLHTVENDNDKFKERFLNAVRALSKFQHDGIVKVLHFGDSDIGMAFAAMELSEGISLRKLLKAEQRLPALKAVKIACRIAEMMDAVHAGGMVHRDLKTDNIILQDKPQPDTVKLVDFAFTYLEEGDTFARAGTLVGSPRYISPEQGGGKPSDARSDIYSLTVCLYEMLTGEKPFSANTSALVLYMHLNDAVPQIQTDQIDRFVPAVNDLIAKGMAKSPGDRYQSMKELSQALDALSSALENAKEIVVVKKDAAAASKKTGSPVGAIVAVIVVVGLVLLGTVMFIKPQHAKKAEAEFDKYQNDRKKKTVAFLEADVQRLQRKKSSKGNDPDYLHNLANRLRALSDAQRESGDLAGGEKSISEAINLFDGKNGGFKDPDTITKLNGELALIKVQAKDYKGAGEILKQAHEQVAQSFPQAGDNGGFNKHEACLIPARLELNIRLHKFDLAGKDLAAAFELSHSIDKDSADAPPAVATAKAAWEQLSAEALEGPQDQLTALSFIDLLIEKLLETDKEMCKSPAQKARTLLTEIPPDTPGFKPIADRTQSLLAKCQGASLHGAADSEKK